MRHRGWLVLAWLLVFSLPALRADDAPAPWKFDVVHPKSGVVLRGLWGEETPRGTRFRDEGGRPTSVLLITDLKEYSRMLREQKQQFLNPAFYDPAGNRIVCASDLEGLGQKLAAVKQVHQRMRADLDRAEADYSKLYKGKERLALLQPIPDKRRELNAADKRNNDQFDPATPVLFAPLYHQAVHGY